jgi:hypothetical protein
MNDKLASFPIQVLKPLAEGFKDSLKLSTAILGSVATVISSFSSHREIDDKDRQEPHVHHG